MTIQLNLFSLLFGLASWSLPLFLLVKPRFPFENGRVLLMMASFCCCIAALCAQLFEVYRRVLLQDWTGLMDIYPINAWIAALLGTLTVVLNLFAWWRFHRRPQKANPANRVK